MDKFNGINIAVITPCYTEKVDISDVVRDFRNALPTAQSYVYCWTPNLTWSTVSASALKKKLTVKAQPFIIDEA